ncbi:CBS domain-containing protein [beta proteobacterium MWH-UniP1]
MNPLVDQLTVKTSSSVLEAVKRMEESRFQIVFVVDEHRILQGLITNGDIRRHLLAGGDASDNVHKCMNTHFRSVGVDAGREEILKLFDLGFHVVPRISAQRELLDLVTPDADLASPEAPILTRARAPVRISFSGGGSDVTYFFVERPGAVLSTTVALYSHATLVPRADKEINIYSEDLGTREHYDSLINLLNSPQRSLLGSVVSVIKPTYGFDLYVRSDFPVGSGLGGSSAVATAVVAAFNEMRLDHWSTYEVAELAFQAERLCFGVAGGWQDQYASAFGGFNLIELGGEKNLVHAIRLESTTLNELEQCLIFCDTKAKHDSDALHKQQRSSFSEQAKARYVEEMVELCRVMHKQLIRGDLLEFGKSLGDTWKLKRGLSEGISNERLDSIYSCAIDSGALGGKLMGAGGGGFFMFFVQPQFRQTVTQKLKEKDCAISSFRFETQGVTSWRTKVH